MGFKFRSRFDRPDEGGEKSAAAAAAEAEMKEPVLTSRDQAGRDQAGRDQSVRMAAPAIPDLPADPPLRRPEPAPVAEAPKPAPSPTPPPAPTPAPMVDAA